MPITPKPYINQNLDSPFKLGHRPALDGMRGISILVVMFHHGYLFKYGQGGFLGVDIFFVLSGFLITVLLIEEWTQTGTITFKNFYTRRALRLLPALITFLMVCLIKAAIYPPAEGFRSYLKSICVVVFYLSNWIQVSRPLGPTWSLSIEEQFYILWPISLYLLLKYQLTRKQILFAIATIISIIIINRAVFYFRELRHTGGEFNFRIYAGTDMRMDALLVGCFTGLLVFWGISSKIKYVQSLFNYMGIGAVLLLAIMIIWTPIYSSHLYYGTFTLVAVLVGIIIITVMSGTSFALNQFLQFSPLVWIGQLSYSLYIWHDLVYWACDSWIPTFTFRSYSLRLFLPLGIKVVISLGLACLSYYYIEQPFLRLKRRYSQMTNYTHLTKHNHVNAS